MIKSGGRRTRQPQQAVRIDWRNPITRGLLFVITPSRMIRGTNYPSQIVTKAGQVYAFDPAVLNEIDTLVSNSSVSEHSAYVRVRHPSMNVSRSPMYLTTRVSNNHGWAFYQGSASGSIPNQLMSLGYVHGSVAAYTTAVDIAGANTEYIGLGFSAKVSDTLYFYAKGVLHTSTGLGGIVQSGDNIRIGREVYFGGQPGDYETPFMAYWNRLLTAEEHASIDRNPWQIYRDRKRRIYVDVSAGGGTTLVTASDSLTPSFTESLALLARTSVADSFTPSLTEALALFSASAISDTVTPGLTESGALLSTSGVTDTATPSVSESVGLAVLVATTDSLTPSVTDTASVLADSIFTLSASDTLTPTLVEAQTSFVTSALSEAFTLSLGETQGSLLTSAVTDVATISVSESAAVLVALVGSDTYIVSITDSAAVVAADTIAKAVTESLSLSLTEVASVVTASLWTDKSVAITVWTDKPDASTTWTEQ